MLIDQSGAFGSQCETCYIPAYGVRLY